MATITVWKLEKLEKRYHMVSLKVAGKISLKCGVFFFVDSIAFCHLVSRLI